MSNDEQARFWSGSGGSTWIELQALMDRQLEPLGAASGDALGVVEGERVLDVGCGCGTTTVKLADAVGASGSVTGVDISEPMLAVARSSAPPNASFVAADAQEADLGGPFDAVFSRFGVMFFAEPVAAFANIGRAVRSGGRLAFVCWQSPRLNEFFSGIGAIGNAVLGPMEPMPATAPGPFAFADPDHVRAVLAGSGWSSVAVDDLRRTVQVFGTEDLDVGVDAALRVGGLARRLVDASPEQRDAAASGVKAFLAERWTERGWSSEAACWLVTARRP